MPIPLLTVFLAALVTALATGLGAVPFLFTPRLSRTGLGFAAGAMVWMAFHELIPEALADASKGWVAAMVLLATAAMLAFQFYLKG